jgi:phosphoketolase
MTVCPSRPVPPSRHTGTRAANYLSVGQIYLYDNPLLKRPLQLSDVKPLVVGHWGTTPGQNFIYVHLNRAITKYDLDMFYVAGPGHGGPALVANTYLEGWTTITPTTQAHRGTHQKGGGRRGPNSARTRGPQTLVPSAGAFQD